MEALAAILAPLGVSLGEFFEPFGKVEDTEASGLGLTGLMYRHSAKEPVPEFRSLPFELEQLAR